MLRNFHRLLKRWFGSAPDVETTHNLGSAEHSSELAVVQDEGDASSSSFEKPVITSVVPYDEHLFERARTQWQFGDWDSLVRLNSEVLQHHPDRAKLALLGAAGHIQTNNMSAAKQLVQLAKDWGCSKKLITQVLVAGVHNSLGCAAAIGAQQNRSLKHFESAVSIGTPGSELKLFTQARINHQLDQLGLAPGSKGRLQEIAAATSLKSTEAVLVKKQTPKADIYSSDAYAFYRNLAETSTGAGVPRFVLLDSKSLPRSGLHYMKNTFARLLEDNFSFCEWYQEPGCCKKMPCALTGFAQHCMKTQTSRLRLLKSHDFGLSDPAFPPNAAARRIILVRDPLFILTSWFALDQLKEYKSAALEKSGIKLEKIWLAHEPEVIASAYLIMDEFFVSPKCDYLKNWLAEKTNYISGFLDKWVRPALDDPCPYLEVVRYEEVNSFIADSIVELHPHMSEEVKKRIDHFLKTKVSSFNARSDPFLAPSEKLTEFLVENSKIFIDAAQRIDSKDLSS